MSHPFIFKLSVSVFLMLLLKVDDGCRYKRQVHACGPDLFRKGQRLTSGNPSTGTWVPLLLLALSLLQTQAEPALKPGETIGKSNSLGLKAAPPITWTTARRAWAIFVHLFSLVPTSRAFFCLMEPCYDKTRVSVHLFLLVYSKSSISCKAYLMPESKPYIPNYSSSSPNEHITKKLFRACILCISLKVCTAAATHG